ncbi:SAF domain-containing protein [Paenibacillus alvei]|uniref:SAF domain-containing protein n=1 Tax=Paenibacillus alvei TaxID=44250 RepID=A0AAP7A3X1_PAEAL|nr:SAF domain-containing protein [Paenibacillus alvei]NOJ72347.1 SAF domain-containing protein [Paenibacillus alvei]
MRRWTRKTKQLIAASVGGATLAGILIGGYHFWAMRQNEAEQLKETAQYKDEITKLRKIADAELQNRTSVWIFKQSLLAGKRIRSDDIARIEISSNLAPKQLLNHPDQIIGKILKIDAVPRTPVIPTMLYEDEKMTDDVRWVETAVIQLPLRLQERDMIDVRIRFPNGQDYIVLSKKEIKSIQYPTIWAHLDEQERLLFSSACVDAYLNGGQIYALRYIEPQMQNKAIPNYPANELVLKLIESDPNIVKKADTALARLIRTRMEKEWEQQDAANGSGEGWNHAQANHTDASYVSVHVGADGISNSEKSPLTGRAAEANRNSPFVGQPSSVLSKEPQPVSNQGGSVITNQHPDSLNGKSSKVQETAKKDNHSPKDASKEKDASTLNEANPVATVGESPIDKVNFIFSEAIQGNTKQ